jgi:hypothetical protein
MLEFVLNLLFDLGRLGGRSLDLYDVQLGDLVPDIVLAGAWVGPGAGSDGAGEDEFGIKLPGGWLGRSSTAAWRWTERGRGV